MKWKATIIIHIYTVTVAFLYMHSVREQKCVKVGTFFFYFPRTSAIALNLYLMTSKEAYKLQWLIRIKSLLQTNVGLTIKVIKLQSVWNTPTPKFVK